MGNFGKLNYFAGARAAREGRESLFPNVDFCKRPDSICNSVEHPDLKWVAGLFFYAKEVQLYPTDDAWSFDYDAELKYFTDAGNINDRSFIDKVSGIVNRGCPSLNACSAGPTHEAHKRAENFKTVLRAFGYPFDGTAPIVTTQKPVTTQGQGSTDGQNNGGQPIAGGECNSSCSDCRYNANHTQNADDAACAPCANGQSWWPCNVENLCYCADSNNETEAPATTTEAPATTTEAVTTEAPATTEAPVETTQAPTTAPTTTTKYTTRDCTQTTQAPTTEKPSTQAPTTEQPSTDGPSAGGDCDASCAECVAIPGNDQAAIDSHCVPCGGDTMQSWWPCNDNICQCKTRRNVLV